jgi:hypothetical protein
MPKLTEAMREERDENRKLNRKVELAERVQADWQKGLVQAQALEAEAAQSWSDALANKKLNMRHLWLVLGVFETQERIQAFGTNESCKSRWFDNIAPSKNSLRGSTGFAARTAAKASQFVSTSGNGYLYLSDLGKALVQHLRGQHPELVAGAFAGNAHGAWEIPGLGELPAPRWKLWKDWGA